MDTKTALLDSAERAVRARGYDGFSYADIAKDVGIKTASIHYHYPAKADLGLGLIQRYRDNFFNALSTIDQRHATAGKKLAAYIKAYKDGLSGGETLCLCVAFAISRDILSAPVLKELDSFHAASIDWLADVFALGREDGSISAVGDPLREAAACLATAEGAQLIARASKKLSHFDRSTAQLKSRIS